MADTQLISKAGRSWMTAGDHRRRTGVESLGRQHCLAYPQQLAEMTPSEAQLGIVAGANQLDLLMEIVQRSRVPAWSLTWSTAALAAFLLMEYTAADPTRSLLSCNTARQLVLNSEFCFKPVDFVAKPPLEDLFALGSIQSGDSAALLIERNMVTGDIFAFARLGDVLHENALGARMST
jgi:hypothetical protein